MDKTCLQIRMQINGALPFTPCDVGDLESDSNHQDHYEQNSRWMNHADQKCVTKSPKPRLECESLINTELGLSLQIKSLCLQIIGENRSHKDCHY